MVEIVESKQAQKDLDKLPKEVIRSYESWARLVESHGAWILKKFPGYRDEMLRGEWLGHRSSRLSLKWRVIYRFSHTAGIEIVSVVRVSAHDYRRK